VRAEASPTVAMELIAALGERLEAAWRGVHYDHAAFPGLARALLEELAPHRSFRIDELIRWVQHAPSVPRQNTESSFGEPPVTLFAGRRFFIEALFWVDGTTTIHQHGFSGAFQVLHGGSLHTRFNFERTRSISAQLQLGTLRSAPPELLRRGDTREIGSGDALIHSLFHLERPSVTLVARTYFDATAGPQYSFLRPGIAVDRSFRDERLPRMLQLAAMAWQTELPERRSLVAELLDGADLHSALLLLERIESLATLELPALLERLAQRDPASAPTLASAFAELGRQRLILEWRRQVRAPEHRFLLALLLNVERRDDILRLVAEHTGAADPIAQVVSWLGEMSPPDESGRAPLSYQLGEVELTVLRQLLGGRSVDEILDVLAADYDDVAAGAQDVRALCAALQGAPLLLPLFR
jgi:hypothetical protein